MNLNSFNTILAEGAVTGAAPNPTGQMITVVGYVAILFFVFYFMAIRPQSKKAKEHAAMLKAMKAGDKVVTTGGVVGTVVSVKDRTISLRSAETKLEVLKSAISEITERSGDAASSES